MVFRPKTPVWPPFRSRTARAYSNTISRVASSPPSSDQLCLLIQAHLLTLQIHRLFVMNIGLEICRTHNDWCISTRIFFSGKCRLGFDTNGTVVKDLDDWSILEYSDVYNFGWKVFEGKHFFRWVHDFTKYRRAAPLKYKTSQN